MVHSKKYPDDMHVRFIITCTEDVITFVKLCTTTKIEDRHGHLHTLQPSGTFDRLATFR